MKNKKKSSKKTIFLVANGDLRSSANQTCEAAQVEMENRIIRAIEKEGWNVTRAHHHDPLKGHGFIDSQKRGIEVFSKIPSHSPVIVAEAVWQYSHHLLPGLIAHQGPILTVANWSGRWPGLVGLLNLNASLTKAGVFYSTLWSLDFTDDFFTKNLKKWLKTGKISHPKNHVTPYSQKTIPRSASVLGKGFAREFRARQSILGVFDEGCMGMYNAIVPDELMFPLGLSKERLSQSALYAKMQTVADSEAQSVYNWYIRKGMTFHLGPSEENDLTLPQILEQCKMYIAAVRMADEFGCSAIGIQYQQGLKDLAPASDLVEGTLNNVDRPPVYHEKTGKELFKGEALPHFNEVDECAGIDGLITYQLWRKLQLPPENTLHDLRWGRTYLNGKDNPYVWVFLISGAVPPEHFAKGWKSATGERQPKMYFRLGGSTLKGISKPGWIVWSRIFVSKGKLHYDTGLAEALELPEKETEDRWNETTSQWPIMHVKLQGISRDQMMARHQSNHIQVVYAPSRRDAVHGLYVKAATMNELGLQVNFCGEILPT